MEKKFNRLKLFAFFFTYTIVIRLLSFTIICITKSYVLTNIDDFFRIFDFFLNYDYLPCYLLSFYQNDAFFQKNKNKIVNRFLLAESKTPFRRVFFTSIYDCVNILC